MYFPFDEKFKIFSTGRVIWIKNKFWQKILILHNGRLTNIGVGIGFFVHVLSNRPMFCREFICLKNDLTWILLNVISIFMNHVLFMNLHFHLVSIQFWQPRLAILIKLMNLLANFPLDIDDYNNEAHEGLHITSMAGTWMSIVEGFGGKRIENGKLSLYPLIPDKWEEYSFKISFKGSDLFVVVDKSHVHLKVHEVPVSI